MIAAWILCTCCVASGPDTQPPARPHQAESEREVSQALQSETRGLDAERLAHLARAIALDPGNALARGLMGLVEYQGRWKRPEAVGASLQEDPAQAERLREYLARRAKTSTKAGAQIHLAEWCEQNGLKDQAQAHYRAALRQDPSKELAWRRLGYRKQGGRWARPEDLAAEKAEAEAQRKADKEWRPRLEKIRAGLLGKDPIRREKAEAELAAIRDPRAVPTILATLAFGGERLQLAALRALGQVEGPSASTELADLAILSESAAVRQAASSMLLTRDPRDVVGRLIGMIRRPFKYKVIPDNGPGTTAQLLVDGERFDVQKLYVFPTLDVRLSPVPITMEATQDARGNVLGPDRHTLLQALAKFETESRLAAFQNALAFEAARAETLRRSVVVQRSLDDDIHAIEEANVRIEQIDARTLPILRSFTSQDFGADPGAWRRWWTDQLGYASPDSTPAKPIYSDSAGVPDVPVALLTPTLAPLMHHSCFAAGTPVRTIDGSRPIEAIAVGDMVLSQDTATGTISSRPVTAVHHNAPAATLRLRLGGEEIVATGIHRFWKAGAGWIMARELKPGDRVRQIGTSAAVESITPDAVQPVYNLEVEGNADFFVGGRGALVHDNSFVYPVETPFDALSGGQAADSH
ncbi:hypothetical protein OJF2_03800 [Aquisphaera giovannonii]|uniref:Hint domain-containing protein n=1 Tax=Aquisphaera giovannonii TaxID=406548 RepID=A0A5B9VU63_9BACT|nr:polymorphic toxin-type HINT domain-containing protein [Aquisphaera giovannonii]QEH31913.1 hypothetical protein OJF2_03800 [Aquisphaera giovannonii]